MCRNAAASNWRPCLRARSRARGVWTWRAIGWCKREGRPKGPCALCMACAQGTPRVAPHVLVSSWNDALGSSWNDARGSKQRSEVQGHARCSRWMFAVFVLKQRLELGNGIKWHYRQDKTRESSSLQISLHPMWPAAAAVPGIANQAMPHRVLTVEPTRWVTNPVIFWGSARHGDGDKDSNSQRPLWSSIQESQMPG
ncbi:hypothetical protein GGI42DRAFT_59036 [Trichoderma sp. SZMC 28013]